MSATGRHGTTGKARDARASAQTRAPAGPTGTARGASAGGEAGVKAGVEAAGRKPSRPAAVAAAVGTAPDAPNPARKPAPNPARNTAQNPASAAATGPGPTAAGTASGGVAPHGRRAGAGDAAALAARTPPHRFGLRVYYEDTDLAGIVYYANYFRFIERARTEMIRQVGIDQGALRDDRGIVFAVRSVTADYLSPARFDDELVVETRLLRLTGARVELSQNVLRGEETLFRATVTLAALTREGRPARMPAELRRLAAG